MKNDIADLLDGLSFFREFSYPEMTVIGKYLMLQSSVKGTSIFQKGDPGSFMLILVKGRISIYKGGEHGQRLLSTENKGRIVGEMALLDRERRSATCIVDEDCEYVSLNQDGLRKLATEYPALAYRFMCCVAQLLSRRLRRASGMMADFLSDEEK